MKTKLLLALVCISLLPLRGLANGDDTCDKPKVETVETTAVEHTYRFGICPNFVKIAAIKAKNAVKLAALGTVCYVTHSITDMYARIHASK